MAFKKGQSGNPGGRPKAALDVQALARSHTEAAIKTLVDALPTEKGVQAAAVLLDRAWGKPLQPTENKNETTLTVNDSRSAADRRAAAEKEAADVLIQLKKSTAKTAGVTLQ